MFDRAYDQVNVIFWLRSDDVKDLYDRLFNNQLIFGVEDGVKKFQHVIENLRLIT